jgi:hypothetical protein
MKNTEIQKLPNIPDEIKEAVNNKKLVIFVGAGVSRIIGCKGWDELANNLVNVCYLTMDNGTKKRLLNFQQKEALKKELDNKKKISICYELLKDSNSTEKFYDEFDFAFKCDDELKGNYNIYKEINALGGINITTNADCYFDGFFNKFNIFSNLEQFNNEQILKPRQLYKIHGTQKDHDSLIFTTLKYIDRYRNEDFINFLKTFFNGINKILFIGYGLSEFELLEYLIQKNNTDLGQLDYFSLMPFYSYEEPRLKYENQYYNNLGIRVIPYEIDDNGYSQLYEVMKFWNSEIHQISDLINNDQQELSELIKFDALDKNQERQILSMIKANEINQNYFFRELGTVEHPSIYFDFLYNDGYFKSDKIPELNFLTAVSYRAIQWNVIDYLINLANKNYDNPKESITKNILFIIEDLAKNFDKRNYFIFELIIKIIFLLPKEELNDKMLNCFEDVLEKNTDMNLISISIQSEKIIERLLNEGNKAILNQFLTKILGYELVQSMYKKIVPRIRISYLENLINNYSDRIIELLGKDILKILSDNFCTSVNYDINYDFIENSFDDILDNNKNDDYLENYSFQILRMLLKCLLSTYIDKSTISKYLENYFNSDNIKLYKVSIFIIGKNYSSFSDIFWNSNENLFENYRLKKDLYNLLEKNCKQFDYKTISKLLNKIDESNKDYGNNSDDIYMKRLFLHACIALNDDRINSKFEEYSLINSKEIVEPNITLPIKYETKRDYKDSDELSELNINELIEYLNTYTNTEYPYVGIEYQFQCSLIKYNERYNKYLNEMKKLDYRYIKVIFHAYYDIVVKDETVLDWDNFLKFIKEIIFDWNFWGNNIFKNEIIIQVSDILIKASYNKKTVFSEVNFILVQEILLFLVEKDFDDYENNSDIISSIINSSYGSIYNAVLSFLLKKDRILESQGSKQFVLPDNFKHVFNDILSKDNEKSFVLKVFISRHLNNFLLYLDKEWTKNNIDIIYPEENGEVFYSSLEIYFIGVSSFYKDIYNLFKSKGYLDKIMGHSFENKSIYNSFMQHVCFGYFNDIEDLSETGFFIKNINSLSGNQLYIFIRFLKELKITEQIKNKITPLCKKIYEILYVKKSNEDFYEAIAESITLIGKIEIIDTEIVNFVIFSIDYIKDEYLYFLPDLLIKHVNSTPQLVGKIFLKLLENDFCFLVFKEKNKELFDAINKNDPEQGCRIKNLYRMKNKDF